MDESNVVRLEKANIANGTSKTDNVALSRKRQTALSAGIAFVFFLAGYDGFAFATALPTIAADFHSLGSIGWYTSAHFIALMAFQPTFGHLLSTFAVERIFLVAGTILIPGTLLCALARSSIVLIVGRLITGISEAGLLVGAFALIAQIVSLRHRALYTSLVVSMFGVGSTVGPIVAGPIVDSNLTWRFCFWLNFVPGTVAVALIVSSTWGMFPQIHSSNRSTMRTILVRLDMPGLVLLLAAFASLTLALHWGGSHRPWSTGSVWGCLLTFVVLMALYIGLQIWMKENASIPVGIMTQRSVAAGSLFILVMNACVGVLLYYLPLFLQLVQGLSARQSSIHNLPCLVTLLVAPMISGTLISVWGWYVPFMIVGPTICAIGSGLMFTMTRETPFAQVAGYQVLVGLGLGLCLQIPFTAAQAVLPSDQVTLGITLVSACNVLGPALGSNVAQSIFSNVLVSSLPGGSGVGVDSILESSALHTPHSVKTRETFGNALRWVFLVITVLSGLGLVCSGFMEWINVRRKDD